MDRTEQKGVACLAEGQLLLWRSESGSLEQVRSQFGAELKERLLKSRQRNEWKEQGSGASFAGSGALWGASTYDPSHMQVAITGVAPGGRDGELFFLMQADDVCGVFSYDVEKGEEQRLFHGTDLIIHALDYSADEESIVVSLSGSEGLHNLALFKPQQGGGFREITEGDSLDTYPRWVPGKSQIVYQTAGIGRNREGHWVETSPCQIARLDFDGGDLSTLLEDDAYDFLLPQMDGKGNLYCIRRPYQKANVRTFGSFLKDILLFPVRIIQGIFGFLNLFTSMFGGKPLTSAGGPRASAPDAKRLVLYGNLVDAEKVMRENSELASEDLSAAVPRSWELTCFPEIGEPSVIARGVMAFAVTPDGEVTYSNGSGVFGVRASGEKPERLNKQRLVQQVAPIPG